MARRRRTPPSDQVELDIWGLGEAAADANIAAAQTAAQAAAQPAAPTEGGTHDEVRDKSASALGAVRAEPHEDVAGFEAGFDSVLFGDWGRSTGRSEFVDGGHDGGATGGKARSEGQLPSDGRGDDDRSEDRGGDRYDSPARLGQGPLAEPRRSSPRVGGYPPDGRRPADAGVPDSRQQVSDVFDRGARRNREELGRSDVVPRRPDSVGEPLAVSDGTSRGDGGSSNNAVPPRSPLTPTTPPTPEFPAAPRFVPGATDARPPSGAKGRYQANIAAIRLLRQLVTEGRSATASEQLVLARWSSWGAVSDVFDEHKPEWATERVELHELLAEDEWNAAARTTMNAHYTDPDVVREIWLTLKNLGFAAGRVLEPGSGSGTFIGLAPEMAELTGVELDPVTAAISQALYPHAQIRAESFSDTRFPEGTFDVVAGNVPFGKFVLHDPKHNPQRYTIHNHFIVKSLRLLRPGGLMAVLTSQYTMDAQNPGPRRDMHALADLVGAIRLPSGAHRRTAGTEAVTDLLIFRRREDGKQPQDFSWETVTQINIDGEPLRLNRYFDEHPERVLGEIGMAHGLYASLSLTVTADLERTADKLRDALEQVTFQARRNDLTFTDAPPEVTARRAAAVPSRPEQWDGSLVAHDNGAFGVVADGQVLPFPVPKTGAAEVRALLRLRDLAVSLLTLEAGSLDDTPELDQARDRLRRDYQKYVGKYGPLNRYKLRPTGRTDGDGKETFARTVPTPIRLLRSDPFGPLVLALENFEETSQTAIPATIMTERVVVSKPEIQGVETPTDAIAVSLDRSGGIDLTMIADLLGMSESDARTALDGLVFVDPVTDELIHAPAYLSGNIYEKLDAATARTAESPAFAANVSALEQVRPEPLGADDITPRIGAVWISAEIHQQFLNELLQVRDVKVENPVPGMWEVRGGRHGIRASSEWGTRRRVAPDLLEALAEQRTILVHDTITEDGKERQVLNETETAAAQEKATALQERFAEWVWEDPSRARTLVDGYNRRFNCIALRDYSDASDYLTFPGLALNTITLRPHQRAAVARMVAEPAVGLFHEVGAGKTAEMVAGAMEMRRMGLVAKPVVSVPNHMLEQFSREWLQLYPNARILTASSHDVTRERRRAFVARAAANDWDAIIMTHSAFERVPMRTETERAYRNQQLNRLRDALSAADGDDRISVKRMQRALAQAEEKLKKLADRPRDSGINFEDTGIDYVIVDEGHLFKNLATESNIRDAAITGSNRASDLHMKLEHLRSLGKQRVVTIATATPISNSITEAYVMQRYLRPDLFEAAGIGDSFDAWAATFGETISQMEMSPTGAGFRMKTRFSKFQNVPEMLRMWSTFADVKTAEDLKLPTPDLVLRDDGSRAPHTRPVPPTAELLQFVERLGVRAERIATGSVDPRDDNMLSVTSDGRKAALDMRLIIPADPSGPSKVEVAADLIVRTWNEHREREYLDVNTGEPSPQKGALQLVFSDLSTPNRDRWNVYEELRTQLIDRGMPAEGIRFIHEAKNDLEKGRLFAAARAGHISVLVGSTERMGVGTNVQARAVALYHLDCPWRPSDIAQREGRILRQGNQNEEIAIVRLVTERSFDSYMWQGVERKARFIAQIMRGRLDVREIEEIDSSSLSAAEAKAISSGNPLLLEHSTLQNEVARLRRLERAHHNNERMLLYTRDEAEQDIARTRADIAGIEAALPLATDTSGDRFSITIRNTFFDSRTEASHALTAWAHHASVRYASRHIEQDYGTIGKIGEFNITCTLVPEMVGDVLVRISLDGVPRGSFSMTRDTFLAGGVGLIQRIENRMTALPTLAQDAQAELNRAEQTLLEVAERVGQPFKQALALSSSEAELEKVEKRLRAMQRERPDTPPAIVDAEAPVTVLPERPELTVEAVRNYQPTGGARSLPEGVSPPAAPEDPRPHLRLVEPPIQR